MAKKMPQFGDPNLHDLSSMTNNFRLYGTGLLIIVIVIVAMGVKLVQLIAPVSLFCVIVSVFSVYIGGFVVKDGDGPWLCLVNGSVLLPSAYSRNISLCNETFLMENVYKNASEEKIASVIGHVEVIDGIPGMGSSAFKDNLFSQYMKEEEAAPGQEVYFVHSGDHKIYKEVYQDTDSTFFVILAIFFPSVTGIFTGCNMSGDLKDPQRTLPIGTIAAQLTTSFVYLSYVFLFGGTIRRELLRDKYGDALGKEMIVSLISWPTKWILLSGAFLSTFGAALQSLCSAPRLLQSIARDDVIPKLRIFGKVNRWNEPWNALWLSSLLAELAILIGSIEGIAPVVDFFFLMCYLSVNAICVLQTWLKSPNWRPRFKYYHWTLSLLGALLCFFIMISTYWYYTLVVFFIALAIYKYVQYKGGRKEWGDGIRGLALSTAQLSLQNLEDVKHLHPKNWRPQLLVLVKLTSGEDEKISEKLIQFAAQLKGGQGLTIVATLLEGDPANKQVREHGEIVELKLKNWLKEYKIKGFTKVIIGKHSGESISSIIQSIGLGGLRPNTVMVGFPTHWRNSEAHYNFTDAIYRAATVDMCLLVPKGVITFPLPTDSLTGNIDVWWIIHAGGLVILLPFLLKMDCLWHRCKLRVFAVAQPKDCAEKMRQELQEWVYKLRVDATVDVIQLADTTISAYVYQRSCRELLHQGLSNKELEKQPQFVVEKHRKKEDVVEEGSEDKGSFASLSDLVDAPMLARKMSSAMKLNKVIKTYSKDSQLTVINLPKPPASKEMLTLFLEYIEALTEDLKRVLLVRGSGTEVITIY